MLAFAVPAFALTWWAACYLVGRDPGRAGPRRAAAGLVAYAAGTVCWTVSPASVPAEVLICAPAVFWAGAAVAKLPDTLPERRRIDLGWLVFSPFFLLMVVALPSAGRLVVVAPLLGAVVLLLRFSDQLHPPQLAAAHAVTAVLYTIALATLLLHLGLGAPGLVLAAIGLDLLMLSFLVALAEALDAGERLRPDLVRAAVAALAATLLVGGLAVLTTIAAHQATAVVVLQFVLVAIVMTGVGLAGKARHVLDALAFGEQRLLGGERERLLMLAEALPRTRERRRLLHTDEKDFTRYVRRAMFGYHDAARLTRSPLTGLPSVQSRAHGPDERGPALRAVLRECVDRLRPAGSFSTGDEWRYYNALHYVVVLGLDPYARRQRTDGLDREARQALDWMRRYVAKGLLREWQEEATAIIARRLWAELTPSSPQSLRRHAAQNPVL